VKHQIINGKMVCITLKQQRRWLHVAGQAAKTIKNVANNIDEQEIKAQLNELEKLLNETTHRTENITKL
jgi:arsenate reductase-like glutaredoxin family protein